MTAAETLGRENRMKIKPEKTSGAAERGQSANGPTNRFAKYGKNISIRVSDELYERFRQLSAQSSLSRAEMFEEFIKNFELPADKEPAIKLQQAHQQLSATFSELEKQLFDVFRQFSEAVEAANAEPDELHRLRAENTELRQLNLRLQHQLHDREEDIKYQKEMIDYLTVEIEKMRSGEPIVNENGEEITEPTRPDEQ